MTVGDWDSGEVTPERVVRALAGIAFSQGDEVKTAERMKALEMLGKYLGMWDEKSREESLATERSALRELLEQRRQRGQTE